MHISKKKNTKTRRLITEETHTIINIVRHLLSTNNRVKQYILVLSINIRRRPTLEFLIKAEKRIFIDMNNIDASCNSYESVLK